jgi:hypothetical protein
MHRFVDSVDKPARLAEPVMQVAVDAPENLQESRRKDHRENDDEDVAPCLDRPGDEVIDRYDERAVDHTDCQQNKNYIQNDHFPHHAP